MKMKELEAATGIGRETIRYYIREGLLPEPVRPKRNVASYDREHVRRLDLIRRLQQERHLPLALIKTILTSGNGEEPSSFGALMGLEVAMGPLLADGRTLEAMTIGDAARETGIPLEDIRKFAASGFIRTEKRADGEWLNQRNIRLMELIAETRRSGYVPEVGYTVESYDMYAQMIELLARRAVVGFYSRLGDKLDQREAAQIAVKGLGTLSEIIPLMLIDMVVNEVAKVSASGELPTPDEDT
ncbi:MAG: MerR family transcriptional regulator [Parvibaculum sp.]|nr:MerR family transcriptional regulator [Parvibaculum sp.]